MRNLSSSIPILSSQAMEIIETVIISFISLLKFYIIIATCVMYQYMYL